MTFDLFDHEAGMPKSESLCPGAVVLRGFAQGRARELMDVIAAIDAVAPFRRMQTPGGYTMSVAITNCGRYGWVTDTRGYRYQTDDPQSGALWPKMPAVFRELAVSAAAEAGYADFEPDACLVNRYAPGAKMGLHQDKNEKDFRQPIVSVSLGVPAVFQFGGLKRNERPVNIPLEHGDVVVWGGPARLSYHGVLRLKHAWHPMTGELRYNLTFRRAG